MGINNPLALVSSGKCWKTIYIVPSSMLSDLARPSQVTVGREVNKSKYTIDQTNNNSFFSELTW